MVLPNQEDQQQIDFMNDLVGLAVDQDLPQDDPGDQGEPPSLEDPPVTDEPPATEEPVVEDEEVLEGDEPPADNVDPQSVIESLRSQVMELMEQVNKDPLVQSVQETVPGVPATDPTQQVDPGKAEEILAAFLTEQELDQIIDKPELLNVAFQRSQKALMATIPQLIQQEVVRQVAVSRAVSDFYTQNSDLLPYSKFVQFVMADVEAKNRDKTYEEIFETTASECRKRLGLAAPAQGQRTRQANNGQQRPAFAGSRQNLGRPAGKPPIFDENARDMLPGA